MLLWQSRCKIQISKLRDLEVRWLKFYVLHTIDSKNSDKIKQISHIYAIRNLFTWHSHNKIDLLILETWTLQIKENKLWN